VKRSFLLALGLAAAPAATLFAFHNHLKKSVPAADETVAQSPKEVRLWFAEKVEPKFSSVSIAGADGAKAETGKARATDDPLSFAVDVVKPLASGSYTVTWRTAGDDGHAVRGTFKFSVK
jgi:hypothetical protein